MVHNDGLPPLMTKCPLAEIRSKASAACQKPISRRIDQAHVTFVLGLSERRARSVESARGSLQVVPEPPDVRQVQFGDQTSITNCLSPLPLAAADNRRRRCRLCCLSSKILTDIIIKKIIKIVIVLTASVEPSLLSGVGFRHRDGEILLCTAQLVGRITAVFANREPQI